jgi:hypothetical protein
MEKDVIFNTDLASLVGDPIEVEGVSDFAESFEVPKIEDNKTEVKKETKKEDEGLIDLEEVEEEEEEQEEEIEEEEKPSSTDPDKKQSSSPFTPYAKLLKEEGVLPNLNMEEFDGTAEGLKTAMINEIVGAVEMYKETLPDRVKDLINNYEEGVPLEQLLKLDKEELQVLSLDEDKIKEDISLQKETVRNYLKKTSKFSDKKIDNQIQYYEDSGELEEEALNAATELKDLLKTEKEQVVEQAKQKEKMMQDQARQELANLNKKIQDATEIIPGLKLNDKVKSELIKSMTVPAGKDKNGNPVNRIVAARMENPMEFEIKLHYLFEITKGFSDFSKLVEKGKKDTMKEFEAAISKTDGRMTEGTFQSEKTKKASDKLINTISKTYNIT